MDTPTSIYHKETIGEHTFTMRELEGVNVARQAPFINMLKMVNMRTKTVYIGK